MKSTLKSALVLFFSVHAFGAAQNLEQMREAISQAKEAFMNDCGPLTREQLKESAGLDASKACIKEFRQTEQGKCYRKGELISYLEYTISPKNRHETALRFGETPDPVALGGVLLWQMRKNIEQVEYTWSRQVDSMKLVPNCKGDRTTGKDGLKADLKASFAPIRQLIGETTLSVTPNESLVGK